MSARVIPKGGVDQTLVEGWRHLGRAHCTGPVAASLANARGARLIFRGLKRPDRPVMRRRADGSYLNLLSASRPSNFRRLRPTGSTPTPRALSPYTSRTRQAVHRRGRKRSGSRQGPEPSKWPLGRELVLGNS